MGSGHVALRPQYFAAVAPNDLVAFTVVYPDDRSVSTADLDATSGLPHARGGQTVPPRRNRRS
jgi:hypothetical protein